MLIVIVGVVSGALILGSLWGLFGKLTKHVEGFTVAMAGGALIVSLVTELIEPAIDQSSLFLAVVGLALGAITFTLLDYIVKKKTSDSSGSGLLIAITLDGIPENMALGVALIGASPMETLALAGSIFLSNLPEAAGGSKAMYKSGHSRYKVLGLWAFAALLLALAAILGNLALESTDENMLAVIRCFAAGAVAASLGTEVFPKAYRDDHLGVGIATVLGVILAISLGSLAP